MRFISPEEFESIRNGNIAKFDEVLYRVYNQACEDTIRRIPIIVNRVYKNVETVAEVAKTMYKDHEEFKKHIDAVREVVMQVEGDNPGLGYKEITDLAVPKIQTLIGKVETQSLEVSPFPPKRPSLYDKQNGEI